MSYSATHGSVWASSVWYAWRWRWSCGGRAPGHHPLTGGTAVRLIELLIGCGRLGDLDAIFGGLESGRMVIIGEPGAGKTAAAIILLHRLLDRRAESGDDRRSVFPVPVLLTLSDWNIDRHERLIDWLGRRLTTEYPFLKSAGENANAVAAGLVDSGRVAVMLDGLDDLPEPSRPVALRILDEQATFRLVLLARSHEMVRAAGSAHLSGAAAVELLPVAPADAADYLARCAVHPPPRAWQRLVTHVRDNPHSPVTQAVTTPLMLSLVRDTYRGSGEEPHQGEGRGASAGPDRADGLRRAARQSRTQIQRSGSPTVPFRSGVSDESGPYPRSRVVAADPVDQRAVSGMDDLVAGGCGNRDPAGRPRSAPAQLLLVSGARDHPARPGASAGRTPSVALGAVTYADSGGPVDRAPCLGGLRSGRRGGLPGDAHRGRRHRGVRQFVGRADQPPRPADLLAARSTLWPSLRRCSRRFIGGRRRSPAGQPWSGAAARHHVGAGPRSWFRCSAGVCVLADLAHDAGIRPTPTRRLHPATPHAFP